MLMEYLFEAGLKYGYLIHPDELPQNLQQDLSAVARVTTLEGEKPASGSGFLVNGRNYQYFLSALHCFGKRGSLETNRIVFPSGIELLSSNTEEVALPEEFLERDIVALRLKSAVDIKGLDLSSSQSDLQSLDDERNTKYIFVAAIGYPVAYLKALESPINGPITSLGSVLEVAPEFIRTSARAEGGFSGGPLLISEGEENRVVGIVSNKKLYNEDSIHPERNLIFNKLLALRFAWRKEPNGLYESYMESTLGLDRILE